MKKETKTAPAKKAVDEVKEAVVEAKKTVAKSAPAKKAAAEVKEVVAEAKKAAAEVKKAAPKKAPAKKTAEPKVRFVLQYAGKEVSCKDMMDAAKAAWTGAAMKDVTFYVKPEENRVYFVVNGEEAGSFEI